jgi:hypothetical protein
MMEETDLDAVLENINLLIEDMEENIITKVKLFWNMYFLEYL